jgi:hypothetical protein
MSFIGFLEAVGKDFANGLKWSLEYGVPVEKLVALLFPAAAPAMAAAMDATGLIQAAVVQVEQKFAAAGVQSGTGAQKLAEVLTLAETAVTNLLTSTGIEVSAGYVTNLVTAVVAILNVQPAPSVAAAK